MVRYFPHSGRTEFSCRRTPFHPPSAKTTSKKKLAQLKNTSKEQQRNLVIFFLLVWKHLEELVHFRFGLF